MLAGNWGVYNPTYPTATRLVKAAYPFNMREIFFVKEHFKALIKCL